MERRIITEVMEEEGLYPDDIPNESGVNPVKLEQIKHSCRYFRCKAFASFDDHEHFGCGHTWKSAHAWCILDLKKQCIAHRWSQECKKCEGSSDPEFDRSAVRRMAIFAVDLCLKRMGRRKYEPRDPSFDTSLLNING